MSKPTISADGGAISAQSLTTRRAALGALASVPALALPAAAPAAPADEDANLLAMIARHREARREHAEASRAMGALEEMLGEDGWRGGRAMLFRWPGGQISYARSPGEIDKWCDPKGLLDYFFQFETRDEVRARCHAELEADQARQLAKREASGLAAAGRRLEEADEHDEELQNQILVMRPATPAGAVALLSHAAEIGKSDDRNPLCAAVRNVLASGVLA